ncbi:hypothetical protein MMC18_009210 [Xylographa bjoerkii]|nr:hypothetical protein [Xylographa bjoerkii]MCJ1396321.1 hypothetical protein [Xylographa bjoerkii]
MQKTPTTVDLLRKQRHSVPVVSAAKRAHDFDNVLSDNHKSQSVLGETPNNVGHGFKRPRLDIPSNHGRLKASVIHNVSNVPSGGPTIYTQRKLAASTPTASRNPLLSLKHSCYDLPDKLVQNFTSLGINSEKNLVYTAPTGGGKSLVADVLMLKRVLENKKAILVLPYVALVQEKLKWLRRVVEGIEKQQETQYQSFKEIPKFRRFTDHQSIRVVGFFGGSKARESWADVDIAVCTIEKANAIVNAAIEDCTINDLGIVVLDELHMIDDDHRGYLMELMATKLLSIAQKTQLVGMSATLSNTETLAEWLGAKFFQSAYKPVPIEEYLVYDNDIYPVSTSVAFLKTASQLKATQIKTVPTSHRIVQRSEHIELSSPMTNTIVALALETVEAGYAVLVFCASRTSCQTTAGLISQAMLPAPYCSEDDINARREVLSNLRSLSVGLDEVLERTIIRGVAFHHAGLTTEERNIITEAYDNGILKVIVATCSLAAGINLPARRVILQGARMGRDLVAPAMLRQMRGRAGRKGKDEIGESYVCCEKQDLEEVGQLLEAELPAVESCLTPEKRGIKRALLEVIAVRLANHPDAVQEYIRRTLIYHTMDRETLNLMVQTTIKDLLDSQLVLFDEDGTYRATQLGQAIVASSLTPEDGIFVNAEFQRALKAFVLDGDMHVFYMFTPVHSTGLGDINWQIFRKEVDGLDESGLRVLRFCGVDPSFVNRMANSGKQLPERSQREMDTARIYRRFYAAFQLRDLCNEIPIYVVARKYETPRGFVQTLSQTCEGFAAGMIKFCERMGWGMLRSVLEHMCDRLKAGAKSDLLDLAKIPFVKSRTARVFWENGFKSIRTIAAAESKDLVPILVLAQPKRSKINGDEEVRYQEKLKVKAEIIIGAANRLWEREQQLDLEADL